MKLSETFSVESVIHNPYRYPRRHFWLFFFGKVTNRYFFCKKGFIYEDRLGVVSEKKHSQTTVAPGQPLRVDDYGGGDGLKKMSTRKTTRGGCSGV